MVSVVHNELNQTGPPMTVLGEPAALLIGNKPVHPLDQRYTISRQGFCQPRFLFQGFHEYQRYATIFGFCRQVSVSMRLTVGLKQQDFGSHLKINTCRKQDYGTCRVVLVNGRITAAT